MIEALFIVAALAIYTGVQLYCKHDMDSRTWYQRMFGYCPKCGRWFQDVEVSMNYTSSEVAQDNWVIICQKCRRFDQRNWVQKLFGYCPCCGRWFQKIELRDGCMVCKDCHEEHEAWKQEMQVDFRKSRL